MSSAAWFTRLPRHVTSIECSPSLSIQPAHSSRMHDASYIYHTICLHHAQPVPLNFLQFPIGVVKVCLGPLKFPTLYHRLCRRMIGFAPAFSQQRNMISPVSHYMGLPPVSHHLGPRPISHLLLSEPTTCHSWDVAHYLQQTPTTCN